ncbi:MAG: hypothetical protein H7644_12950, partial [Candidatus Heimdallarchaeota archaeon]|nr:hypothetical protein [Candidatus Heimdallarchaeota archaeon]MCK5144667.1 hypothetical protein [Candidatus Heimdallarchaeota archaeon]
MNRKTALLSFALLAVILPTFVSGSPFYYVPNTMIEDVKYGSFSVIVEEGFYFLVFDNTGYITDNYTRFDSYVMFTLDFAVEGMRDIAAQRSVKAGEYNFISFNFDVSGIIVSECDFEMTASETISAFLTDSTGLAEYFEETADLTHGQRQREIILVSSISASIVATLLIVIIFMR